MPALLHPPSPSSIIVQAPSTGLGVLADVLADRLRLGLNRAGADAAAKVAQLVRELAIGWTLPAAAPARDTWRALAALGREDLAVGRLVEGHVDALWILHEAGREPVPGAVYGVWASASGGTGLTASTESGSTEAGAGWSVDGTMRYCSGAWFIDRALVVVSAPDGKRLVDLDVRRSQLPGGPLTRDDDSWPAVGMDVTRSVDIGVRGLAVSRDAAVGGPGFYLDRPGFAAGGVGVAAVWLGGAAGVLDALVRTLAESSLRGRVSAHQRAHLGSMAVAIAAADALLAEVAERLDHPAGLDRPAGPERAGGSAAAGRYLPAADAAAARTAVELAVEDVLRRAPRVSGPTPLCRDAAFGHRLADLEVYVRQHHAEVDYEHLGSRLLESGELLGRRFG